MPIKFLRSGSYEDTPIEQVPDEWLKGALRSLSGVSHPFTKVEERMIRNEYHRRFSAEDARKVAEAHAAADARTAAEMAPVFTPAAGEFHTSVVVSIVVGVPDATVYYTVDGEDPTDRSTRYAGPITVPKNATLKAVTVARRDGKRFVSAVASADYTVVGRVVVDGDVVNRSGVDRDRDRDRDGDMDRDRGRDGIVDSTGSIRSIDDRDRDGDGDGDGDGVFDADDRDDQSDAVRADLDLDADRNRDGVTDDVQFDSRRGNLDSGDSDEPGRRRRNPVHPGNLAFSTNPNDSSNPVTHTGLASPVRGTGTGPDKDRDFHHDSTSAPASTTPPTSVSNPAPTPITPTSPGSRRNRR